MTREPAYHHSTSLSAALQIVIRRAGASDAERLSRFAASSFRDAFGAQNTAEDMATYVASTFSPGIQAAEIAEADSDVLVVEPADGGANAELLGYAHLSLGAPTSPVKAPAPIELRRFYIARALHGTGAAAKLMDAVLATSRARGAETLWLGVWEKNPRAIAFYVKHGFTDVGQQSFQLGHDLQSDRIMVRPLGPAPVLGPYFPVSMWKFVVMSLLTLGIYDIYWTYYQWKRIRDREREELSPFWRTFFGFLWNFSLLPRIAASGAKHQVPVGWNGTALALGYLVSQFSLLLPMPWQMIGFVAFAPLIPAAITIERINRAAGATEDPNARFSGGNWIAMILGGPIILLALLLAMLALA